MEINWWSSASVIANAAVICAVLVQNAQDEDPDADTEGQDVVQLYNYMGTWAVRPVRVKTH